MSLTPGNPIVGGTILRRPAIQSPNFIQNVSGWAINQDGTAYFNELVLTVSDIGILIYEGTPGLGTLWLSLADMSGVDTFGNVVPQGLSMVGLSDLTSMFTIADINGNTLLSMDNSGNINATNLYASDDVFVAGSSLTNDILPNFGQGIINRGWIPASGTSFPWPGTSAKNTEVALGELDQILYASRLYRISTSAPDTVQSNPSGAYRVFLSLRYTTDGSTPTTSSTEMFHSSFVVYSGIGTTFASFPSAYQIWLPSSDAVYRFLLGMRTNNSSYGIQLQSAVAIDIEDVGDQDPYFQVNNAITLGSGGSGGSSKQNYTKTYYPNQTYSYFGDDASGYPNTLRDTGGTIYQGGETASGGSFNGTQYSYLDFSGTSIQSDLSGATIRSIKLTMKNVHSWYNGGMTALLAYAPISHTNNSSPSGKTGIGSAGDYTIGEGAQRTWSLPNSVGTAFGNGNAKSIMLGPGPSYYLSNYGYFAALGSGNGPYLTVKYTK